MADFTNLEADLEALKAKVAALVAAQVPPAPPVDDQPSVEAADAKVKEIIGLIP